MLKWSEEWELADLLNGGINEKNKNSRRPPLFRCPAQEDPLTTVPGIGTSHYVITVRRLPSGFVAELGSPLLHDRELLSDQTTFKPWYIGPEMSLIEQQQMFSQKKGPHQDGQFYSNDRGFPE